MSDVMICLWTQEPDFGSYVAWVDIYSTDYTLYRMFEEYIVKGYTMEILETTPRGYSFHRLRERCDHWRKAIAARGKE